MLLIFNSVILESGTVLPTYEESVGDHGKWKSYSTKQS